MNLLEKYVYNITSVKEEDYAGMKFYKLICDTDCCGDIREQEQIILNEYQYKMVEEKGYYMC